MVEDLTVGTPWKRIVLFAVPLFIGNAFQQVYNVVDSIIIGRFMGPIPLAGVGAASPVYNFLIALLVGFSVGSSIAAARLYGGRELPRLRMLVTTVLLISLVLSAMLMMLALFCAEQVLEVLGTPDDANPYASRYLKIVVIGFVFSVFYNQFSGLLRGLGDSRTPLYFLILCSCLNVGLDFAFVVWLKMGVAGAAYATVLSQAVSAVVTGAYIYRKVPELRPCLRLGGDVGGSIRMALKYGLPMGLQQSSISLGHVLMQGIVNTAGTATVVAYSSATKIDLLAVMPIISLGSAITTYAAQCVGKGDREQIRRGFRSVNAISTVMCVIFSAVIVCSRRFIITLFIGDSGGELNTEIITIGSAFLCLVSSFYLILAMVHNHLNVMAGTGDTVFYMLAMIGMMALRILFSLLFVYVCNLGYQGICIAIPISWTITLVVVMIRFVFWRRKMFDNTENARR